MKTRMLSEIAVGLFILAAAFALVFLAFQVSGIDSMLFKKSYHVSASFQNIGDLHIHAPVTLAGVKIGEVSAIALDEQNYDAVVTLRIDKKYNQIPKHLMSANIYTQGLLGANYIAIIPGTLDDADEERSKPAFLQDGDVVEETQSAIILENLISHFMFNAEKAEGKAQQKTS